MPRQTNQFLSNPPSLPEHTMPRKRLLCRGPNSRRRDSRTGNVRERARARLRQLPQTIEIRQPFDGRESQALSVFGKCLQQGKKIVVVSGAGISVNAGSKPPLSVLVTIKADVSYFEVPDFQTMRKSGQVCFDRSVYASSIGMVQLHNVLRDLWKLSTQATPTVFHMLMDTIARDGRLLRHYTQNVDCIEQRLPDLSKRTVQLHGRIDEILCRYCGWNGPRTSESFSEACSKCEEVAK